MNKKLFLKILIGIAAFMILWLVISTTIAEPWIKRKIESSLNTPGSRMAVKIDDVDISLLAFGIKFERIIISGNAVEGNDQDSIGQIAFVDCKGINVFKALFSDEWRFNTLTVSDFSYSNTISLSKRGPHPFTSPVNLFIKNIYIDHLEMNLEDSTSAKSYKLYDSRLSMHKFSMLKGEKLVNYTSENFDFESPQLVLTSPNGMYTFLADTLAYSSTSETLSVRSFKIQPNYKDYDFTSRERYQTDRIEATFLDTELYGICADDFIKDSNIMFTALEIGDLELDIFRDRRKPFDHKNKPVLLDLLYEYPHCIDIDSLHIRKGNIKYTEHAEDANRPGHVNFRDIAGSIYMLSNDTIHKNKNDTLVIKTEAMVYGKSKLRIVTKARLFEPDRKFRMTGRLAPMSLDDLDPILERNAYMYARGKINALDFDFTANKKKATGRVLFLYSDLNITLKNKNTDDTTGLKEIILTRLANKAILDSNPLPGEETRIGTIEHERDPEKMFFNYCLKAVISGMKSSVDKSSKKKK
ncbi:MAG TPA: hypothetical protein VFG10_13595 [Saprospiraceae bacterium]|nr:hypothetical protein [Saprospiraceae bacterium]